MRVCTAATCVVAVCSMVGVCVCLHVDSMLTTDFVYFVSLLSICLFVPWCVLHCVCDCVSHVYFRVHLRVFVCVCRLQCGLLWHLYAYMCACACMSVCCCECYSYMWNGRLIWMSAIWCGMLHTATRCAVWSMCLAADHDYDSYDDHYDRHNSR
jgi:hypothetical protein